MRRTRSREPRSAVAVGLYLMLLATGCASNPTLGSGQAESRAGPAGTVSLVVGSRTVGDWDSEPTGFGDTVDLGDHTVFGIDYASISESGLGFEGSLLYSSGSDDTIAMGQSVDLELSMLEVGFGARYTMTGLGPLHPYVGAGLELIVADLEAASSGVAVTADDTDYGAYAHGGVFFLLGRTVTLGVDVRALTGTDNDLDHTQVAATLGLAF